MVCTYLWPMWRRPMPCALAKPPGLSTPTTEAARILLLAKLAKSSHRRQPMRAACTFRTAPKTCGSAGIVATMQAPWVRACALPARAWAFWPLVQLTTSFPHGWMRLAALGMVLPATSQVKRRPRPRLPLKELHPPPRARPLQSLTAPLQLVRPRLMRARLMRARSQLMRSRHPAPPAWPMAFIAQAMPTATRPRAPTA